LFLIYVSPFCSDLLESLLESVKSSVNDKLYKATD